MRHRSAKNRLGKPPAQRRAMIRNLATSLALHGHVTTTVARAKVLSAYLERLVARVQNCNDMNAIRFLAGYLYTSAASRLFLVQAREFKVKSGFIRCSKLGMRDGDSANMCYVSFVSSAQS